MNTLCFRFGVMAVVALLTVTPGLADRVSFGYGGSIFGGSSWEIRSDDTVTFAGYGIDGEPSENPDWVWTNKTTKSGSVSKVVPGAYARAIAIVLRRIQKANLGPAPAYQSNCTDAGHFNVEVESLDLTYSAVMDACIENSDNVPRRVKRHYKALKGMTGEIHDALQLKTLF